MAIPVYTGQSRFQLSVPSNFSAKPKCPSFSLTTIIKIEGRERWDCFNMSVITQKGRKDFGIKAMQYISSVLFIFITVKINNSTAFRD